MRQSGVLFSTGSAVLILCFQWTCLCFSRSMGCRKKNPWRRSYSLSIPTTSSRPTQGQVRRTKNDPFRTQWLLSVRGWGGEQWHSNVVAKKGEGEQWLCFRCLRFLALQKTLPYIGHHDMVRRNYCHWTPSILTSSSPSAIPRTDPLSRDSPRIFSTIPCERLGYAICRCAKKNNGVVSMRRLSRTCKSFRQCLWRHMPIFGFIT